MAGVHKVTDLMEHDCDPLDEAPVLGEWRWRCHICGQRWDGVSRRGGVKEAWQVGGRSIRWLFREWRRRRAANQWSRALADQSIKGHT